MALPSTAARAERTCRLPRLQLAAKFAMAYCRSDDAAYRDVARVWSGKASGGLCEPHALRSPSLNVPERIDGAQGVGFAGQILRREGVFWKVWLPGVGGPQLLARRSSVSSVAKATRAQGAGGARRRSYAARGVAGLLAAVVRLVHKYAERWRRSTQSARWRRTASSRRARRAGQGAGAATTVARGGDGTLAAGRSAGSRAPRLTRLEASLETRSSRRLSMLKRRMCSTTAVLRSTRWRCAGGAGPEDCGWHDDRRQVGCPRASGTRPATAGRYASASRLYKPIHLSGLTTASRRRHKSSGSSAALAPATSVAAQPRVPQTPA